MFGPGRAVRRVKHLPREPGWGWCPGEAQVAGLGGEKGIRTSPASSTHSTDSSSQPSNSSSGAHVIKRWTNCESPLKKKKSSVSPPRPYAWMRFPQEPLSWQSREPCAEPESPRGDTALCCWRQPGVPRSQGTAGTAAGDGGSTADQSLVDQQYPAISHCEGSCLVRRFRKLFNPACVKLLLPEGIQIGSPIRPLRGAPV